MKNLLLVPSLLILASAAPAQLTVEQKIADFHQLAALLAKNYAPYEWKVQVEAFDLFELEPWLDRVRASKDDLEFLDVCARYIGALNDGHTNFGFDTDFFARLGLQLDIYEGKALIDSIDRTLLPARDYPFEIGDELVALDGKSAEEWLAELAPYSVAGNPLSSRRFAANLIGLRPQSLLPRAPETGEAAHVVIRRQNGEAQSFTVKWVRTGTPVLQIGSVPSPGSEKRRARFAAQEFAADSLTPIVNIPGASLRAPREWETVLRYGSRNPAWALPDGFSVRLGREATDHFLSGTFSADGFLIGYIRIPSFAPPDQAAAATQYRNEIEYLEANTDGLVVDVIAIRAGVPVTPTYSPAC